MPSSVPPTAPAGASDAPALAGPAGALLLLRLFLGLRGLLAAADKFELQGTWTWDNYVANSGRIAEGIASASFLPVWMTQPYALALPWLLGATGALVLLGIKSGWSLLATGLLYVSLASGLMAAQEAEGVAWLAIHVGVCAGALVLVRHERLALWPHRKA